jgi:hypothetical protein
MLAPHFHINAPPVVSIRAAEPRRILVATVQPRPRVLQPELGGDQLAAAGRGAAAVAARADERVLPDAGQVARRHSRPQPQDGGDRTRGHRRPPRGLLHDPAAAARRHVRGHRAGQEPIRLERGVRPLQVLHQELQWSVLSFPLLKLCCHLSPSFAHHTLLRIIYLCLFVCYVKS